MTVESKVDFLNLYIVALMPKSTDKNMYQHCT